MPLYITTLVVVGIVVGVSYEIILGTVGAFCGFVYFTGILVHDLESLVTRGREPRIGKKEKESRNDIQDK